MNRTTPHQSSELGQKHSVNWGFLLVGILSIAAALLAFINPGGNLEALAFVFAFLAVIDGIWLLVSNLGSIWRIVGGILDILIGIFLLANIYLAVAALPFIFAVWFIVDSVIRLIHIGDARVLGTGYFIMSLIFNILGIAIGVMLLFNPITAALTLAFLVGFYLVLAGVEFLAMAFQR